MLIIGQEKWERHLVSSVKQTKKTKVKIRRSWGKISPITKIKESDKAYNRKKHEKFMKKIIKEGLAEYKGTQP